MRTTACLLALLAFSMGCHAQKTRQDYEAELEHKTLYLRGLWGKNDLRFNGDGTLAVKSDLTSPLLASVEITGVDLKPDRLVLKGRRRETESDGSPVFVDVEQSINIVISQPADGDYDAALGLIFTTKLSDLGATAPEVWRNYLTGTPGPGTSGVRDPTLKRVGGGVTPPILLHSAAPEFSEESRRSHLSGTVLVYLHVDQRGMPTHIKVLAPLGHGLDENAVAAVAQYRFKPATENGQPVEIEMNVLVTFRQN